VQTRPTKNRNDACAPWTVEHPFATLENADGRDALSDERLKNVATEMR